MGSPDFGKLERVDVRTAWKSEAGHFTPWLAQEENLNILANAIGIELELVSQEKRVGEFKADIVCKNPMDDSTVLIENQLERTDHTHLGQLLTYAAGLDSVTIVWIAERFTEEHRAALDWLNEITGERHSFLGIEIEIWRIDESKMAPRFNIICKPNDWSREVRESAEESGGISEAKQIQLEFWRKFINYMTENSEIQCQKPAPHYWMNCSIGKSGFHLAAIISTFGQIRVDLVMPDERSKERFTILQGKQKEIESAIGQPLDWHNPPEKRMCRISIIKADDFFNRKQWPTQFDWLRANLELFRRVFGPIIKSL